MAFSAPSRRLKRPAQDAGARVNAPTLEVEAKETAVGPLRANVQRAAVVPSRVPLGQRAQTSALIQRAPEDAPSAPAVAPGTAQGPAAATKALLCAPPVITEELEGGIGPAAGQAANAPVPTTGSSGSGGPGLARQVVLQRQVAGQVAAPGAPGAVSFTAQQLTWDDFPTAEPDNDFAAQTGFTWAQVGNSYSARFNRATSWARAAVKQDTSPAGQLLLRHEQYHLRLIAMLAAKATAAATGGTPVATVNEQMRQAAAQYTQAYDDDTQHGLRPALQTAWENDIDNGVVAFPP